MKNDWVTDDNIKNLTFRNLLSMYQLRDHEEIVKIFKKGLREKDQSITISKSKVKSWRTDPDISNRGTPMPNKMFYAFICGLVTYKIEGEL